MLLCAKYQLLLPGLFDDDQAAFSTRHSTVQADDISLGVNQQNLQVLGSYLLIAHVTGSTTALIDAARGGRRAARAWGALAV